MSDDVELLKTQLTGMSGSMKANHLKAAKALVDGKTQEEAYRLSGGKAKDGYSAASEMLKLNPKISQYIEMVQKIAAIELLPKQIGTLEQKRTMLWKIAQRCVQEVEPEFEGYGDDKELVGYTFNAKGAIGAISELNKMDGDLAAIKTDNKHNHAFQELTEEQLDGRIAELQRQAGASVST